MFQTKIINQFSEKSLQREFRNEYQTNFPPTLGLGCLILSQANGKNTFDQKDEPKVLIFMRKL